MKYFLIAPVTLFVVVGASALTRRLKDGQFRSTVEAELAQGCPELPAGALEALKAVDPDELETNHLVWKAEWAEVGTVQRWRLEAHGRRGAVWSSWDPVILRISNGQQRMRGAAAPAAQVRNWSPNTAQIDWHTVFEKISKDDALVKARLIK